MFYEKTEYCDSQFEHKSGDRSYNLESLEKLREQAADAGAMAISFHECPISGYTFARDLSRKKC